MSKSIRVLTIATGMLTLSLAAGQVVADEETKVERRQYTFSWPYAKSDDMRPRGGMTRGPDVNLTSERKADWARINDANLKKVERDRLAILAMAGAFRTSFDFLETVGFTDGYKPDKPYQSWATEYVYVVADQPKFVSLQHVIVMFFKTDSGETHGPMVVKHWRQDWRYEDRELHVYRGHSRWSRQQLDAKEVSGAWSQAVYQVDDSPRYEAIGRWEHFHNYSSWESARTWRPLPRREFSVRNDYQVLIGRNRHTITPQGWVHEEDNLKVRLNTDGTPTEENPVLARELGLNRYEHIVDHKFDAGDEYWRQTQAFWREVRAGWQRILDARDSFKTLPKVNDKRLFQVMFGYATELMHGRTFNAKHAREFVDSTLAQYVKD